MVRIPEGIKSRVWSTTGDSTEHKGYKNVTPDIPASTKPNPATAPNDLAAIDAAIKRGEVVTDDQYELIERAAKEAAKRRRLRGLTVGQVVGEVFGGRPVMPLYDGIDPSQESYLPIDPRRPEIPADLQRLILNVDRAEFPELLDQFTWPYPPTPDTV